MMDNKRTSDCIPDYVQTVVVKDSKGMEKVLLLPKALDLDRPKRSRTAFAKWQLDALEATFCAHPYLVGEQRTALARRLGLSETQIKVWYQNRRTKQRKEKSTNLPESTASEPSSPPQESAAATQTPSNYSANSNVALNSDATAIRWPANYHHNELFNQTAFQYRTNIYQQLIQSYGTGSMSSPVHHSPSFAGSNDRHRIF